MTLTAKARRYIGQALKEFGSTRAKADWEEWDRYSQAGDAPLNIQRIALSALVAKAEALDKRIDADRGADEDALSDMINELGFIQSVIRALKGERVPA